MTCVPDKKHSSYLKMAEYLNDIYMVRGFNVIVTTLRNYLTCHLKLGEQGPGINAHSLIVTSVYRFCEGKIQFLS